MITRLIETNFHGPEAQTTTTTQVGDEKCENAALSGVAQTTGRMGRGAFLPLLRLVEPEDLPVLNGWWMATGLPALPKSMPKLGVVAHYGGQDLAAGFAVMSNCGCGLAMIQFLMVNPLAGLAGPRSLDAVLSFLCRDLEEMGYTTVLNVTRHGSLSRLMRKHGFQEGDTGMTHYIKIL